jgi:hypothetical protein
VGIELIILKRPGYRHSARISVRVAIASCAEHTASLLLGGSWSLSTFPAILAT